MEKLNFKSLILALTLLTIGTGQMWGAKERYIYCGISEHYDKYKDGSDWGFNFWGGTSEGVKSATYIQDDYHDNRNYKVYRVQVYDNNNKAQFKGNSGWWIPDGGKSVTLNGTTNNAVYFSAKEDGWLGQFQKSFMVSSTGSLSASSTSVAIGTNVTLTPSLSSNSTYNEIKSTSYDVTTNPNSGGSVTSAGVFSATKAGTYVVTATITYNAKDFTGITKTVDVTKTITVYATVTFDKEGGSSGTNSQNATYNSATSSITAPSKSYYDFSGYWTGDDGTGTMVINASGVWQKNISNFTDNSATPKWIILTNQTLYAKWTPKNYSITYKDEGNVAYSGSNSASLPSSYTYGTGIASLTDGVKSGYRFDGWFDNSSCTGSAVTSISSSATGAKTFYAKWTENPGGTVTLTAGTGGEVSKDNSSWGTSKSYTGIKTTDALNIYARANAGYTFSAWSKTSGSGTITNTGSASTTFTPVADADAALTASFTENKVTLTPTVSYDHGSSNYTASSSNTVGVATTTNLSCSNPNAAHYTFAGWTLTNLTVTSGNAATDRNITVKIDDPEGATPAAVANYNEVLTTSWKISGDAPGATAGSPFTGWGASGTAMTKKSGRSTEEIYYCNITVSTVASSENHFAFQVYDGTNHRGYNDYWITKENNSTTVCTGNPTNMKFRPYVTGTYEFKVDNTGANPVLTVTWPVFNQVRISVASPTDATNTGNFDLSAPVSNVRTVTRSLKANTTYTFKIMYNSDWYGQNSGALTRSTYNSSNSITTSADGGDMTLTTDYAGDYTFKFNQSTKALSVDFPAAYKVTYGKGSVDGSSSNCSAVDINNSRASVTSNSTWVLKGHRVELTAPEAKAGYSWKGWYANAAGTEGKIADDNRAITVTMDADKTLYACYKYADYTITLDVDEAHKGTTAGATTSHTVTYQTVVTNIPNLPSAENYYGFDGYYTGSNGAGVKLINSDGTWIAGVDGYTDEDKKWISTDDNLTLYAYYKKAEITALTFVDAIVAQNVTNGVKVTPTVSPTPIGTTHIDWRVLYNNGNPLTPQPSMTTYNTTGVQFTSMETSGTYLVEAVLRTGSTANAGTKIDSVTASFQVAGTHTVTIQYKDASGNTLQASGSVTARPLAWSDDIEAPDIFGYTFARWDAGDGVTIKNGDSAPVTTSTDATINIKATYDGRLTAVYNQNAMIYFKNTLGWSSVYVNFYGNSGYWDTSNGSGNKAVTNRNKAMTRIGETDVWYYDYGAESITPSKYVSFTEDSQNGDGSGAQNFWKANSSGGENVVYPTRRGNDLADKADDLGFYAKTPMFVPLKTQTPQVLNAVNSGKANYYNDGYWTKYTAGTGYTLEVYHDNDASSCIQSVPFTSADELMPMTAVVDLEASTTYRFQLKRDGDAYYGNSGTMTYSDHGQSTAWDMTTEARRDDKFAMCKLTTNASGDYTFNLSYSGNSGTPVHYCLRMEVDYPIANNDYRLVYSDAVQTKQIKSAIVTKANNSKDTVSFFIRPTSSPVLKIQQASVTNAGVITWNDYSTITSSVSGLTKDSVYNICLTMNGSGTISVESVDFYAGNYYIRTNAAGSSKWDNFRSSDHLMTYSEYSERNADYSHYFMTYVENGTNIKFVVANDYAPNISDTLAQATEDAAHVNTDGDIYVAANVRFMWDKKDNSVGRAYLAAAKSDGSKFLVLRANSSTDLMDENGYALINSANSGEAGYNHKAPDNSMQFIDDENWIYETTVKVKPGAYLKLYAHYHDADYYYKGKDNNTFDKDNAIQILGGTGSAEKIHVIYDFKTDRLMSAWMPTGNIDAVREINADVMFVREHQGDIQQLTFSKGDGETMGAITEIKTAYGVLRFNKWTLNNKSKETGHAVLNPGASRYERDLFYVSFPFRVAMNEVFGFGQYGKHWIIEEYDGAGRAVKGFWADSKSFWNFITDRKGKFFEPNQGYIIALDLDQLGESSSVWDNGVEQVELYFPSYGTMGNITSSTVVHNLPAHTCTINRPTPDGDRTIKDSHWNVMSVPTYVNTSSITFANTDWITEGDGQLGPNFLYTWNMNDNTLTATSGSGYTYHAMHAYMVQYYGNVTWNASVTPASAPAARRVDGYKGEYEFRLELLKGEEKADQTFVKLTDDEHVTTGFEFNYDLSKEFNKNKANIYTMVSTTIDGDISVTQSAANVLPFMPEQTTVVPVGVKTTAAGEYTFSMPDGTDGIGVTLIDNVANTQTNLALGDYTVSLPAGTIDNRFSLSISPIQQAPTSLETIEQQAAGEGARKVMVDGILYIVRDGKIYDARGQRAK